MRISPKGGVWLRAIRPFSFTASVIPVLVGAVLALSYPGEVSWFLLPMVVFCSLLLHAATNLVSEYYDFESGVDREYTYGSSKVLVQRLLSPRQVLVSGLVLFGSGSVLGMIMVYFRGAAVFWLGVAGLLGGFFYTGKPVGYKYMALGDLIVFILMGPLMVIGSHYVMTGSYNLEVFFVSLPIGFLVAAILHANNLRDIGHDSEANVRTVANIMGLRAARMEYYLLVGGAYLSVIIMVLSGTVGPWALLVFLSVPPAARNIRSIHHTRIEKVSAIAMIDVQTARLHFLFGGLMIAGIILSTLL